MVGEQAVEGFEGGGIKGQLERLKGQQAERSDRADLSGAAATAPGQRPASLALARAATQRFGVAGAYDVRLPALTTEAIVFGSHGRADEVCRAEPAWPLGRVLRYGEVLVKMIAAPLTETDLRWIDSSAAGAALPAIAGHDGVGIVVATSKCVLYPPPLLVLVCHLVFCPLACTLSLGWVMSILDYEIRTRGAVARDGERAAPGRRLCSSLSLRRELAAGSGPAAPVAG